MPLAGPLLFEPILKRIRWGGRRLGTVLGKPLGPHADYAESWEIADMGPMQSVVATGPMQGQTLAQLIATQPQPLLGTSSPAKTLPSGSVDSRQFPLLVKFLDASDRLSLQVHPNDAQAQRAGLGLRGKTEAWIVLDSLPDATLFAGLKSGVTRQQLEAAVLSGEVEALLHRVAVRPGDCLFIPAGTVHALGEGVLLAEVQQSSDITYRLFDWNRVDAMGQPRELHVADGLACVDFHRGPIQPISPTRSCHSAFQCPANSLACEELVQAPQFHLRRLNGFGFVKFVPTGRWAVWIVTHGQVRCIDAPLGTPQTATPGTTWLWPADRKEASLEFAHGTSLIEATCDFIDQPSVG